MELSQREHRMCIFYIMHCHEIKSGSGEYAQDAPSKIQRMKPSLFLLLFFLTLQFDTLKAVIPIWIETFDGIAVNTGIGLDAVPISDRVSWNVSTSQNMNSLGYMKVFFNNFIISFQVIFV